MEQMTTQMCAAHRRMVNERCARDKERLDRAEEQGQKLTELSIQMGEILKQMRESVDDHETRIDHLEHRPTMWFDKIVSALIAAAVSAFVAFLSQGA